MKRASLRVQRLLALFVLAALLFAAPLWWPGASALLWFGLWAAVIALLAWLMERPGAD